MRQRILTFLVGAWIWIFVNSMNAMAMGLRVIVQQQKIFGKRSIMGIEMTREEKEQTGKYMLKMAEFLKDGCYQHQMLLKAAYIIDESLGQESIISEERECALEIERHQTNGGPFAFEEWCRCTNCNYRHALFIPREYCPRCGYKFTETIEKPVKDEKKRQETAECWDKVRKGEV